MWLIPIGLVGNYVSSILFINGEHLFHIANLFYKKGLPVLRGLDCIGAVANTAVEVSIKKH